MNEDINVEAEAQRTHKERLRALELDADARVYRTGWRAGAVIVAIVCLTLWATCTSEQSYGSGFKEGTQYCKPEASK